MPAPRQSAAVREVDLPDPGATSALARAIAPLARAGDVIGLAGALGTGKTTFARAFVHALARAAGLAPEDVPSPTFTLVQVYELGARTVCHFDLYRIERPEDALELGIEDAFADAISLIEWPERLGYLLPPDALSITFREAPAGGGRTARIVAGEAWNARLAAALGGEAARERS